MRVLKFAAAAIYLFGFLTAEMKKEKII